MIQMASCAKEKLKVPGQKLAHSEVLELFQQHLRNLKQKFMVSN
jgi:hypothetical protein